MPRPRLPILSALAGLVVTSLPSLAQHGSGAAVQAPNPAVQPHLVGEVSRLSPDFLYQGWRSRQLIGQAVAAAGDGRGIGSVRDLIVDKDGRVAALLVEGGGAMGLPEAIYRVPWNQIDLTPGREGIVARLAGDAGSPQYGLFPGTEGVPTLPREYRVTELVGDDARLQMGRGYGYVTDAVFTREGRLVAVLIGREAAAGGGIFAFPAGRFAPGWDPGMSYYGLPFVTASQADEAGLRIELRRFSGEAM